MKKFFLYGYFGIAAVYGLTTWVWLSSFMNVALWFLFGGVLATLSGLTWPIWIIKGLFFS